ncbi:MAG: amidohydrolase [Candidatus Odinarchaeota archaeon]|nr:amidohydrolase [Candidatus Odinarchaeota archaeon]
MVDLLIKNGYVITVDEKRRIIKNGAVAIDGNKIVDVGKTDDLIKKYKADEVIDAKDKIVMPGLIDTHVHLAQAMIRGCADDVSLITWLKDRVWVLQGNYNAEDGKTSAELCILEMLKTGTTTFLEVMIAGRYGFDGIAKVVEKSGIRAGLSKIVMDTLGYANEDNIMYPGMAEEKEATIKEALDMHKKWDGAANGRIHVWFGPRTPGAVSPELYREIRQLADEHNMRITFHLGEVKADVEYTTKNFNLLPVEYAKSVGMLGPDVVLAHGVWFSEKEIKLLAETGTHVSHNPSSNLKLASGYAPIPEMLRAGVNVGLGCDGGPSNNSYDMIREMKLAAIIHKARLLDPLVLPAEEIIEMATINGAKAMGLEKEIGSIEKGKKADIILVDMNAPHMVPPTNPVSNLVYAAHGYDVDTVIIDGKVIVGNKKVLTMDEEDIKKRARERAVKVYERAGIKISPQWPVE